MTKYYVHSGDYKQCIYEGFDYEKACIICSRYNKAQMGDYYIDEEEFEDPEELDNDLTGLVWYEEETLTALWGDDEAIKRNVKELIEGYTGREVIDFDLSYTDPSDTGDNATFTALNIKYKK